jgi:hypothetical protein
MYMFLSVKYIIGMKIELIIFAVTGFLMFNAYHDGVYTKMFVQHKKYIQIAFYAFIGLSIYLLLKRNPQRCKNLLLHANNMVKYMPIDKSSMNMISPILDFTSNNTDGIMGELNTNIHSGVQTNYEQRVLQSGSKGTKRSVSETKKKYVASMQSWKCKECNNQLNAWFEVDHVKRLEHGGGNNVDNLVALCRECHGKKTAMENM